MPRGKLSMSFILFSFTRGTPTHHLKTKVNILQSCMVLEENCNIMATKAVVRGTWFVFKAFSFKGNVGMPVEEAKH